MLRKTEKCPEGVEMRLEVRSQECRASVSEEGNDAFRTISFWNLHAANLKIHPVFINDPQRHYFCSLQGLDFLQVTFEEGANALLVGLNSRLHLVRLGKTQGNSYLNPKHKALLSDLQGCFDQVPGLAAFMTHKVLVCGFEQPDATHYVLRPLFLTPRTGKVVFPFEERGLFEEVVGAMEGALALVQIQRGFRETDCIRVSLPLGAKRDSLGIRDVQFDLRMPEVEALSPEEKERLQKKCIFDFRQNFFGDN